MNSDLVPLPPKVPIERRAGALAIDALIVTLLSSLISRNFLVQIIFFLLFWLGMRVFLPLRNQGQSLGRWALDMKVVDTRFNRTPGLQELVKREGLLGFCAALASIALTGLTSQNAAVLLLLLPLAGDGSAALADTERYQQAFHDRLAGTIIVGTRRGYSLDIKLKKLLDQVQRTVRR